MSLLLLEEMTERIRLAFNKPEMKREKSPSIFRKSDSNRSMGQKIEDMFFLQKIIGNQAAQRLIKSHEG